MGQWIPARNMTEGIEVNDSFEFDGPQGIDPEVFDDLQELKSRTVNEFGEIEEDSIEDDSDTVSDLMDLEEDMTFAQESTSRRDNAQSLAQPRTIPQTHGTRNQQNSWLKRSHLAPNETDQEFELFTVFCNCGEGRSIQYISQLSNLQVNVVTKIAQKNCWKLRVADYDRYRMAQKLKEAESARHERHMRKLEEYRQQQETLGHQLSLNAAHIASLANKKLRSMLDSEQEIELRDMPSLLNTASKLAEVGKNLQSSALGVDQLLAAIEEAEIH